MNICDNQDYWNEKIRRWQKQRVLIWTTIAIAFLTGYFHRTVIGVVADSLMRDFAIERAADLGILASIYFWTYAALQIPAGISPTFSAAPGDQPRLVNSAVGSFLFAFANTLPCCIGPVSSRLPALASSLSA